MSFRINTNIAAMNAHASAGVTNRNLSDSLEKLSSGLRINKAADDASGMAIADSLRSQSKGLGQAINNANDAIGIVQIADKAMDEQTKILNTIQTKAVQAAQDGQTADSRNALQKDINRLMEELDNIAYTTSYNGQSLLSGSFSNKSFQIGAYSNETVTASIGATQSAKIGHARYETGLNGMTTTGSQLSTAGAGLSIVFSAGTRDIQLQSVAVDYSAGSGMGALANAINANTVATGVKAAYVVQTTTTGAITVTATGGADITSLYINGVNIGNISGVQSNDADGRLVNAINKMKEQTGVEASVDSQGKLVLNSNDGRAIVISTGALTQIGATILSGNVNTGRLTLSRLDAQDIVFEVLTSGGTAAGAGTNLSLVGHNNQGVGTLNLANVTANINSSNAQAIGAEVNSFGAVSSNPIGAGVTSLKGAMAVMDIAESAQKLLDTIRADLGSVQNQLVSTINNISVTQVNVAAAESQIRDVDFAHESANFSKNQILAQSGSYAMSQANAIQQNVMRLLQ